VRWILVKWWVAQKQEAATMWIAWHLPRSLVYWATIRLTARATTGEYGQTDPTILDVMTALKRWAA
jgi:hypothetical protein